MIAFAYYLLKMFVCSGALFLYYHLALRNKIFHQWNRFYLLASIVISLAVPCLQFNIWPGTDNASDIKLLQVVYSADEYVAEVTTSGTELSLDQWITIFYSLVSAFVFLIFILALIRIYSIIRSHSVIPIDDIIFVNTEEKSAPFSFLNYVFWNKQIDLNSTSGEHIFQHELVHVREKHTWDKLFLQVVLIVFWWNPFFWLIIRELRMIHEFIADKKSIGQSDAHAFATMILHAAYPQHYSHLTSQFFHSSIKRRLAMLTKNSNPKISYLSRVLALPLMAFLILAFTVKQKKEVVQNKSETFKSFTITDTVETTSKESEIIKFLNDRINLNKSNRINNDGLERSKMDLNEGRKKDTSMPNPLIVIDGKEVGKKSMIDLNQLISPEKIESLNVLKGETAKAKYGKRGEDGVIEIITKQGVDTKSLLNEVTRQNFYEAPPLVIIDGQESDKLKELSPDEIASISVLKGTSAINKYGEKGKGGVIEIVTKPSKQGKTSKEIRVDGVKIFPSESKSSEEKKNNQIEVREVTLDKPELNEVVVVGYGKNEEALNKVFEKMEKEPEFPGGTAAWQRFLQRNLKPTIPADKGAPSGSYTVTIQFIVDIEGNLSSIVPLTKHGYGMEEEVIRLIKTGPKWVPGVQNGHNVNAYKKQNVTFVISIE